MQGLLQFPLAPEESYWQAIHSWPTGCPGPALEGDDNLAATGWGEEGLLHGVWAVHTDLERTAEAVDEVVEFLQPEHALVPIL